MNCTPYQAAVQLTVPEARLLNQIVGRYAFSEDMVRRTQVQALDISWSPGLNLLPSSFTFQIHGHACAISLPCVSSLPQVREILQNIPWTTLDSNLQLATLEVALEDTLNGLERLGGELSNLQSAPVPAEMDWTFRVHVEWLSGAITELILAVHSESLSWLASQLQSFVRQATQDLGWLPLEADVVCGTTRLALADIAQLSAGDQVLFTPCNAPTGNATIEVEGTARPCQLVFRQISLTIPGHLQSGVVHRSAPPSLSSLTGLIETVSPSTAAMSSDIPLDLPLSIVVGTVNCSLFAALYSESPLQTEQPNDGQLRLQHATQVIARGHVNTVLNRPAFMVAH